MKKLLLSLPLIGAINLAACTATVSDELETHVEPEGRYEHLLARFDATVASALFDPRILQTPEWRTFRKEFGQHAMSAENDKEFEAAFSLAYNNSPPFSHLNLWYTGTPKERASSSAKELGQAARATFYRESETIGVIRIETFQDASIAAEIQSAFDEAIAEGVTVLALDLRGNPGGSIAAWPVLDRLYSERRPIGHLVSNRWFSLHDELPNEAQLAEAKPITSPDLVALQADLFDDGLLTMAVDPVRNRFDGTVYVLVDKETASTSEVVAGSLQFNMRARLVGTYTAGEVLNADIVPLADGISLLVPLADFLLPDGRRIEGVGLTPDYSTSGDALECVKKIEAGDPSCN